MHVSLRVKDVEASRKFYEALFGEPAHKVQADYVNFDLVNPPLKLALNQLPSEGTGSLDHLGIIVDSREAVQAARDRMTAAGLTLFSEEEVECCYATQDKVWVTDPDGHSWEIYVILDDMQGVSFEGRKMNMIPMNGSNDCCR